GRSLQRPERGPHEQLAADERGDRVAREAEDEHGPAYPERHGLARPDGDAPEDLLDAELRLDAAEEVVRADGHAARGNEHVVLETLLDGAAMRGFVVRDGGQSGGDGTLGLELSSEHDAVRLVPLARPERRPGRFELRAGGQDRRAW